MRKVIAIDFDGCLCKNMWPFIGAPNFDAINAAIQERKNGAALILWTCRVDEKLEEAIQFCKSYGLEFDAINDNLPERVATYNANPRKVNADEYWDDLSVFVSAEKRGEWIYISDWPQCSICGASAEVDAYEHRLRGKIRPAKSCFCPNCGAKMQ